MTNRVAMAGLSVLAVVAAGAADAGTWVATCSVSGRVVFQERVAGPQTQEREAEIQRRNPGSVCIFLASEEGSAAPVLGPPTLQGVVAPGVRVLNPGASPQSMASALRALRGERLGTAALVQPPPVTPPTSVDPRPLGVLFQEKRDLSGMRPPSASMVRLSVYRGATTDDVVSDWERASGKDPVLAGFVPVLLRVDDYVMLSVGPVTQAERADLCLAATSAGLECRPGPSRPGTEDAATALAASYPEKVAPARATMTSPRSLSDAEGMDREAASGTSCVPGFASDARPFDIPRALSRRLVLVAAPTADVPPVPPVRVGPVTVPARRDTGPRSPQRPGAGGSASSRSGSAPASMAATSVATSANADNVAAVTR